MLRPFRWEEESTLHYFLSDHPNIVTLHENIELGDYAASLLDYCSGGSLHDMIYDYLAYAGDSARIKSIFLQIVDAVEHCHTNYIYHRDLKPLNVLCNEDGSQIFLTDFGLATRLESSQEHTIGTAAYMSPGTLKCYREKDSPQSKSPYSPEANDVWSLGVLFLDLACADRIWEAPTSTDGRYREFNEDSSAFLRSHYPLNNRTRALLLRIFSPQPYRISLKALREEIASIDDFYLPDCEIASAAIQVQKNAMRYGPWTKLAEKLNILHRHGDRDVFTDSGVDPSVGELVDINLTTQEDELLPFRPKGMKDGQFTPCIVDLDPFTI
ncbi:kinase-like protein [Thelephora ganbajun]|uniref:Kinase-like protein n=1 Tax=Thelephora ganbajun TaxID=370292 RepID=A0ACB6ZQ30_THEGA|nr:kinase-like protein [Thelephora ganbajun]